MVTGGASGIGRAIAMALRTEGARVVIADIEEPALLLTADEVGATPIRTDVADPNSVAALAQQVVERFGTVDVVCNNAGVGAVGGISELTLGDWRWMIDVNLWGVIHGIHSFLPILRANADGGHIVNTASMAGLVGAVGLGSYSAAKFAVVGLSEVLAEELADEGSKIGVTILCPGTTRTNISTSTRNRPAVDAGMLRDADISDEGGELDMSAMRWIAPEEVGRIVVDSIKAGRRYAITHPEWWGMIESRFERLAGAFGHTIATRP